MGERPSDAPRQPGLPPDDAWPRVPRPCGYRSHRSGKTMPDPPAAAVADARLERRGGEVVRHGRSEPLAAPGVGKDARPELGVVTGPEGNNRRGQCALGNWRNLVGIAAGYLHTIGLQRDGLVIATGDRATGAFCALPRRRRRPEPPSTPPQIPTQTVQLNNDEPTPSPPSHQAPWAWSAARRASQTVACPQLGSSRAWSNTSKPAWWSNATYSSGSRLAW